LIMNRGKRNWVAENEQRKGEARWGVGVFMMAEKENEKYGLS
jgi:hypothetical protein